LFVRLERAQEAGLLTVILVHTLAHIRAGFWADDHPRFITEYMNSLRFLCSEFFFNRIKSSGAASTEITPDGQLSLHEVFGLLSSQGLSIDSKDGVVSDLLDLTREGLPDGDFSAPDIVFSRLNKFENFARSCQFKLHLHELEAVMANKMKSLAQEQGAPASTESPQIKLKQRLENLHAQSDELNSQLVNVITDIQQLSEKLIGLQSMNNNVDVASIQLQLEKLDVLKASLLSRLDSLERRRLRIKKIQQELS